MVGGMTRLSKLQVERIRAMAAEGYMLKTIARASGVSYITIVRKCADIPKPVHHAGKKKSARTLCWSSDRVDW